MKTDTGFYLGQSRGSSAQQSTTFKPDNGWSSEAPIAGYFLSQEQVRCIQEQFGTPIYVYDEATLKSLARDVLAIPAPFGLTVRYAMKAISTRAILKVLHDCGLHIDASSGFEAERALRAGIPGEHIQLTSQEVPADLVNLVEKGVSFNACSLTQLSIYGLHFPGNEVSLRVNPGLGSGHTQRTNTGGPASSFGIWHEQIDQAIAIAKKHDLVISRLHSHIGAGTDPEVWEHCANLTLAIARMLPDVHTVNLGGGFKVARMPYETGVDLSAIGAGIKHAFEVFAKEDGRKLKMEVEPGTYLTANAGAVISTVSDIVTTGPQGYRFIKLDSGMTEIVRPSMYGSQHPIAVVPHDPSQTDLPALEYLVVGHCCESGDILTPGAGDPEALAPRSLTTAHIGDAVILGGTGAYCSSMSTFNYNSFPRAAELLLHEDGTLRVIRKRQSLEQVLQNEL